MTVPRTLTSAAHSLLRCHGAIDISGPRVLELPCGRIAHLFRGRREESSALRAVVIVGDNDVDGPRLLSRGDKKRLERRAKVPR